MRLPEVVQLTGVSRSTIYRWMANVEFPKQVLLGANSVAWLEAKVDAWIKQRIGSRQAGLLRLNLFFDETEISCFKMSEALLTSDEGNLDRGFFAFLWTRCCFCSQL